MKTYFYSLASGNANGAPGEQLIIAVEVIDTLDMAVS